MLVNNNGKKRHERSLPQRATTKATTYDSNKLHMLKNKQTNFAFSCPISPVALLCYLVNCRFREGSPVKCKTASSLTPARLLLYEELSCGYFIVMQINVTIKNIILEDVSGVITHMASSQLSSRWISPFNWVWNFSARCFMRCILSTFCWTIR